MQQILHRMYPSDYLCADLKYHHEEQIRQYLSLRGENPRQAPDLLARVGLAGGLANAALWTAALLDIALGVALLLMRSRALLYVAQLVLVATYTLVITIWLPEQWSHPFGPVLKNLPLLAMIAALAALDRGDGPDPR